MSRKRRGVRWLVAIAVIVLAAVLVATQGVGMGWLIPRALAWAAPEGWRIDVRDVEGAWTGRIRLTGLDVQAPGMTAEIERLELRYDLVPLFRKRIRIEGVEILRPVVLMDEGPDTSSTPSDPDTAATNLLSDSPLGSWTLSVDGFDTREGRLSIATAEVHYQVDDLHVRGSGALEPSGLRLDLDTLGAQVVPSAGEASGDSARTPVSGRIAAVGRLADGLVEVERMLFETTRSRVHGAGTIALVADPPHFERVDFELSADPLDLRDLPLDVPAAISDAPTVHLEVVADGAADSVHVRAEGRGPASAKTAIDAVVRTTSGGVADHDDGDVEPAALDAIGERPELEARVEVRGVELEGLSPAPFNGTADADVRLELARLETGSTLRARGTLTHHAPADTVEGVLGQSLRLQAVVTRDASGDARPRRDTPSTLVHATLQHALGGAGAWRDFADVEARLSGSHAAWNIDLRTDSSTLRGAGSLSWTEAARQVEVERLVLTSFDLRRMRSDLPTTSVSGRLAGRVSGSGRDLDGRAQVHLDRSSMAAVVLDTLALTADLTGGVARGQLLARDSVRELLARYEADVGGPELRADVPSFRLASLATVPADSAAELMVSGRASGSWVRSVATARRGSLDVRLDSARISGTSLADASLHAELAGERVRAEAGAVAASLLPGTVRLDASLDARGAQPSEMLGTLDVLVLRTPEERADSAVATDPARTASDSLVASVVSREPGRFLLDGRLIAAAGGRLDLDGRGSVAEDSASIELDARGALPAGTELLDGAALDSLNLHVSAVRDSATWQRLDARLLATGGAWEEVAFDTLRADVVATSDVVRLDVLRVDSNVLSMWGSGSLSRSEDEDGGIEIHALLLDARPIRDALDAEVLAADSGALDVVATGTLDSVAVEASLALRALATGNLRLDGLRTTAQAVIQPSLGAQEGIRSGSVDISLSRLLLPDTEVRSVDVTAEGGLDSVRIEAEAIVDDTRTGTLTLVVDRRPESRTALLEKLDFQLDDDRWQLLEPALVSYRDGVHVDSLQLEANDQRIAIDGGVDRSGRLELAVDVDSTNIGTVTDLAGIPGLEGWIAGQARLSGTVDAPRGVADLRGMFHRPEQPPASARIALDADGRVVSVDARFEDPQGGALRVDGSARLPGATDAEAPPAEETVAPPSPLGFTVTADGLSIAWVLPFVHPSLVAELGGTLEGEMSVRGSVEDPQLDGTLALSNGMARLPPLGLEWRNIRVVTRGSGAELVVDTARISSGTGELTASGTAAVADSTIPIDLSIRLDDFQAIRNESYWATVSGSLHASGSVEAPVVEGDVRIESLDVYLDQVLGAASESLRAVELTEEDFRMLEERFGYVPDSTPQGPPLSDRLTADLSVEFSRDSWLRKSASPEMAVAFTGEVDATLRPGDEPALSGTLEVIERRGYIEQFGKRFELNEGTVTLDGAPSSAALDLAATYSVPSRGNPDDAEATIVLAISGTQDSLSLTLSSEPPMENADILSYLATGRPASSALAFNGEGDGEGGLMATGADIALGQIAGAIEGAAARRVGLDVVEIRREGLLQATLVVGKYVTPKLFVGFARPITRREGDGLSLGQESETEIEVEVQAWRWLLVNIEGSGSALRLFLRGHRAY